MIAINNLAIFFSGEPLFEDINFNINDRDRIGLVGKNGAGKSTLLKIIAQLQEPDKGVVVVPNEMRIGYLPQEITSVSKKTVFAEALNAFTEAIKLDGDIKHFTSEISGRTDYESDSYYKLIDKLNEANERFILIGGNTMNADIEKTLTGLGFVSSDFERPLAEFSGGWQMRVELAKLLLQRPDVILLDEPTNHLDIESIQWLENMLISYAGAVVLVSHDRAFLDNITNRTIEISLGKITDYKASYSDFVLLREERREQEIAAYNNQQKQIEGTLKFIERFRYKATKSRQVQSKIKMLDKMDMLEIEDVDNSAIHFKFPPAPSSGKVVLDASELSKSYGEKRVLNNIGFSVLKGERVAFVGKNGEGKTTLSKIIVGDTDFEGNLQIGFNVKIGYYAQNQADLLNPSKTVFETLDDVAVGDIRVKLRAILGSFLFSGDTIDKKVSVLSGGEKSRLAIAKLLLNPVNLLILDEPTNHLDMLSKDILKNALLKFDGTLIVVSHDRDFLQGLTNKVFEFKNNKIKEYNGDIYDFLESRNIENLKELEINNSKTNFNKGNSESANKQLYEKRKIVEKEIRKIASMVEKIEQEIESLELELKMYDEQLLNPETYKDFLTTPGVYNNYQRLKSDLDKKMNYWNDLNENLREIQQQKNELN